MPLSLKKRQKFLTISLFTYFEEIPIDKSSLNEHIVSFRDPEAFNTLKFSIYFSNFSSTFIVPILDKQEVQPVDEIKSAIFSIISLINLIYFLFGYNYKSIFTSSFFISSASKKSFLVIPLLFAILLVGKVTNN